MSMDWQTVFESKRALRRDLAARPIAEKLRLLDALRERELAIRSSRAPTPPQTGLLRQAPRPYCPAK